MRKPTGEELSSLLRLPGFGRDSHAPLVPSDVPAGRMGMRLSPLAIDFYDRNPRQQPNPEYEAIRDSIRATGLVTPLTVTRRPGEDRWILARGGNTRLRALKELLESGDLSPEERKRIDPVTADYIPWTQESDLLIGHLIENETRGALTLLDRARAVRASIDLVETERGSKLSQREACAALSAQGYKISQGNLNILLYVLDVLAEALPQCLSAGMGRHQVRDIRALEKAARRVWESHQLGGEPQFEAAFTQALARADEAPIEQLRCRREVEAEIARLGGIEMRLVSAEIGVHLDFNDASSDSESSTEEGGVGLQPADSAPAGTVSASRSGEDSDGGGSSDAGPGSPAPGSEGAPRLGTSPVAGGGSQAARRSPAPGAPTNASSGRAELEALINQLTRDDPRLPPLVNDLRERVRAAAGALCAGIGWTPREMMNPLPIRYGFVVLRHPPDPDWKWINEVDPANLNEQGRQDLAIWVWTVLFTASMTADLLQGYGLSALHQQMRPGSSLGEMVKWEYGGDPYNPNERGWIWLCQNRLYPSAPSLWGMQTWIPSDTWSSYLELMEVMRLLSRIALRFEGILDELRDTRVTDFPAVLGDVVRQQIPAPGEAIP
jgi:ParB-like nuclease domain.